MKLRLAIIGFLAFAISSVFGQSQALRGSAFLTNSPGLQYESGAPPANSESTSNSASATIEKKGVRASGPLVYPLKARKPLEVPKRIVKLFSPFAPVEKKTEISRVEKVSPLAWTTVAGWNPGQSAFANEETHESQMRLVTFSRDRE